MLTFDKIMKRYLKKMIAILMALLMMSFCFVACADNQTETTTTTEPNNNNNNDESKNPDVDDYVTPVIDLSTLGTIYFNLKESTDGQTVGEVANFGWNSSYTIAETGSDVFLASPTAEEWSETWYWCKDTDDANPEHWTYNALVRFDEKTGGGTYLQLFFGTASEGGRYSLLVNPSGGGYLELWHDGGEGKVANSWLEVRGATMNFGAGKDVSFETGKTYKITIKNTLLESGNSKIEVLVNDVVAFSYEATCHITGDFGIGLEAGVQAQVGNIVISE